MAETSKNKIYYNDNENSAADVLADMKKLAQSTDDAIEKSKYNDTQIKKDISNMKTEITAKDNAQDNKILQLQTEKAELEKELKEAQEDFYQNSIRGQASGEYIHVEDSSNCRAKIGISGNSEQETRSGKNLIRNENIDVGDNCYWYSYSTFDKETYTMTRSTTNTTESFIAYRIGNGIIKNNTQYTISFEAKKNDYVKSFEVLFIGYNASGIRSKTIDLTKEFQKYTYTFTTDATADYKSLSQIRFDNNGSTESGKEAILTIKNVMLVEGTDTGFEPYGASPSPDYPSEVESCGDNINLFDKNDITNNTSINVKNGNTYTDNNSFSTNFIKINGITELCCNGLSDASKLWGAIYDENKSYIKGISTTNGIFNETNLSGATYIRLGLLKTYLDTMKLEKGKVATPYTPYGQGCINEVICNRNLFNTDVEQGSVSTDTGEKTSSEYSIRTEFIKVTPNKEYILKYSTDLTSDYNTKIVEFDKNKAFLKTTVALPPNKKLSITTNNQTEYVIIAIYSGTKLSPLTYTNYFKNIEFKQNDGSEYIEHKKQTYTIPTQQPFRARGDIRDTFIKKNNKWYERHYINRLILNGTESWDIIGTNTTGKYRFQTKVSPNEIVNNQDGDTYMQGFCNRLIMGTPNTTYLCQTGITTLSGYLIIYNEKATDTIDNFKAWLSSNNLTVDYLLKTPLDIECTEEQSKILDELNNARTYKNVTNIYSTDEISPILSLDYAKDLETLLTSKESEV